MLELWFRQVHTRIRLSRKDIFDLKMSLQTRIHVSSDAFNIDRFCAFFLRKMGAGWQQSYDIDL